jgi:transposase
MATKKAAVIPVKKTPAKQPQPKESTDRVKRLAYILFVENGLEQKVIAGILNKTEATISAWKAKYNWDEDRRMQQIGPDKQMRRIMKHYDTLLTQIEERQAPNNVPNSKEADTLNKLSASVKNLQTEVMFGHKTEVGKQFITYLQQTKGQAKAIEVIELWHEFLMATQ